MISRRLQRPKWLNLKIKLKFDLVDCVKFRVNDCFWLMGYKFASNLGQGCKLLWLVLNLIENGNCYAVDLVLLRLILFFLNIAVKKGC